MLFTSALGCALAAGFLGRALAHNIQMGAHSRECFHEQLRKDDKMTVTFQVGDREFGGSGNLEIDFWVRSLTALLERHPFKIRPHPADLYFSILHANCRPF